jgi:hypothetical protein
MTMVHSAELNKKEVLALRGIRLPRPALKSVAAIGIYCEPAISLEYQPRANRYVLRGRESGGAAGEIGFYCGFVGCDGQPLSYTQRVETVARNGVHAIVIEPELVRVQVFRYRSTYELLVTEHTLKPVDGKTRPAMANTILFHGVHGTAAIPEPGCEACVPAQMAPVFYQHNGEVFDIPEKFREAARLVVVGCHCSGCHSCHLAVSRGTAAAKLKNNFVAEPPTRMSGEQLC